MVGLEELCFSLWCSWSSSGVVVDWYNYSRGGSYTYRWENMGRRCKYDPGLVVKRVLDHPLLYRVCEVVFTSPYPLHSSEVGRRLGVTQGYAYTMLSKLEKWGVVEPVRDPVNGKTMFKPSSKRTARILAEEMRKRRIEELLVIASGVRRENQSREWTGGDS
ncbi:MAG: winged helix-turn-helix domain-containing protein [Desulfurococcaceae archaeon]